MSRKKTHEEYVAELAIKNPTVEVIGTYVDSKTKILHHCLKHDVYWGVLPLNALKGKGCKECAKEKNRNKFLKSHEQYVEELKAVNPDIIVLETYMGGDTPIMHLCKKHNIKWKAYPNNILKGQGCAKCGKEKIHDKRCKKHKEYVKELAIKNPTIEVVGEYVDGHTPILHHCLIHNIFWYLQPVNALRGDGCNICHKERIGVSNSKTHEQYIKEVNKINPDIEIVGCYIDIKTPILHKCKIDGYVWNVVPHSILCGYGCPQCNESSGERQVRQWLTSHNIDYEYHKTYSDCRDVLPLSYDFYLPKYNLCIEYQGEQHYKPISIFGGEEKFKLQQKHDNIKREYCKNNDIGLLEIPYYESVEETLNNFLFI